jgi:hypothetical protein
LERGSAGAVMFCLVGMMSHVSAGDRGKASLRYVVLDNTVTTGMGYRLVDCRLISDFEMRSQRSRRDIMVVLTEDNSDMLRSHNCSEEQE